MLGLSPSKLSVKESKQVIERQRNSGPLLWLLIYLLEGAESQDTNKW